MSYRLVIDNIRIKDVSPVATPELDPNTGLSPVANQKDLINLFSDGSNCTSSAIIHHLSQYDDHSDGNRGCFQYLVNKLYELKPEDIEFYLPQLLYVKSRLYLLMFAEIFT
jgi:hypothetical protein